MKYLPIVLACVVSLSACGKKEADVRSTESIKAKAAAESIQFTENAEIENIKARLQLTANPGLLGFVILLNETGQPVMYTGVKGKITSGGKRLNRTDESYYSGNGSNMRAAPSDEGTYGSSGEYIYFWSQNGQYIQWNGKYLYSDKPFRLTVEPIVIDVTTK